MRKQALYLTIGLLAAIVVSIYSCKKLNGIDNGQVIETPYSLYFSDTSGTLFSSTDGRNITKVVFPPDGKPCRALITSGSNILWAKNNLYLSENNGLNFNGTYDSLPFHPVTAVNGYPLELNQSMILNTCIVPAQLFLLRMAAVLTISALFTVMPMVQEDPGALRVMIREL